MLLRGPPAPEVVVVGYQGEAGGEADAAQGGASDSINHDYINLHDHIHHDYTKP